MRRIVCDECGKWYDYERDDFCPRCGAYNQPVKTWTTDDQGNVRRVDGLNEANHAESFAHSEVHREKRVRRIKGMDRGGEKTVRQQPTPRPPAPRPQKRRSDAMLAVKVAFALIAAALLISWIIPWIALFM